MTDARTAAPADLVALIASAGQPYRNQSWPRERLGDDVTPSPLGVVLKQYLTLGRGRSAWVCTEHQKLLGLVAARPRGDRSVWEIDYVIDGTEDGESLPALIDCATAETGNAGAEKLFVRLALDSELLQTFREAGFVPFREEVLYKAEGLAAKRSSHNIDSLEPVVPADSYPLYRLYTLATPEAERRYEAATFEEWHAAQEKRWMRKGSVELVQTRAGRQVALVRASRLGWGTLVDLISDVDASREADALVAHGAESAGAEDAPVYVLVRRSAENVARRLEDAGFVACREFVSCMHRTTVVKTLPRTMPTVQNAIGAS